MSGETRQHDFQLTIQAPAEAVWRALTEGERIRMWFAPHAEVQPGDGGRITLSWGPGMEGAAPITLWEPGKGFGWTEHPERPTPRVVEFTLQPEGARTRLRLLHTGFSAQEGSDAEFESTRGGWLTFLAALRYYAERGPRSAGRHAFRLAVLKSGQAAAWAALVEELGLSGQDWTAGAAFSARIPGGSAFSGSVVASPRPGYALLRITEMDDSLLGLFVEDGGSGSYFTASWYLYGSAAAGEPALLAEWERYYAGFVEQRSGG